MEPFIRQTSTVFFIPGVNCDTDQIIPARFLKENRANGYDRFLFHDIRRDGTGSLDPQFPLNRPEAANTKILLVEDNFGCGSSREGAVYALVDSGIRVVIGPSFGDIFYNNALKNGLIPVCLPADVCEKTAVFLQKDPKATVTVDLESEEVELPGELGIFRIEISEFARQCILKGLDEIEMTLTYLDEIERFEVTRYETNPWLGR